MVTSYKCCFVTSTGLLCNMQYYIQAAVPSDIVTLCAISGRTQHDDGVRVSFVITEQIFVVVSVFYMT